MWIHGKYIRLNRTTVYSIALQFDEHWKQYSIFLLKRTY